MLKDILAQWEKAQSGEYDDKGSSGPAGPENDETRVKQEEPPDDDNAGPPPCYYSEEELSDDEDDAQAGSVHAQQRF